VAKYLVKELSFINNSLVPAGEVIDYDPPEGTTVSANLEPVKKGKAAKDAGTTVSANLEPVKKGKAAKDAAPEPGPDSAGTSTEVQP
jgi:hypothetical protein